MNRGRKERNGGAPPRGDRRDRGGPRKPFEPCNRPIGYNKLKEKLDELDGPDLAQFCLSDGSFLVLIKVKYSNTCFN